MAEERVSIALAAKIFGISKSAMLRRMKAGKIIRARKDMFGYYYWPKSEFETYLANEHAEKLRIFKDGY